MLKTEPNQSTRDTSTLWDLRTGESAWVRDIAGDQGMRRHLLDLGFVPGTKVTAVRRSPFGDPAVYEVRGTMIALRKEQASQIRIIGSDHSRLEGGNAYGV